MSLYMHVCECCVSACMRVYVYMCAFGGVNLYMHVYVSLSMCVVHVYVPLCVYVCVPEVSLGCHSSEATCFVF